MLCLSSRLNLLSRDLGLRCLPVLRRTRTAGSAGIVRIHRKLREIARSLTGGSEKEEKPPVIRKVFQTKIRSLGSERDVQVPLMQRPHLFHVI